MCEITRGHPLLNGCCVAVWCAGHYLAHLIGHEGVGSLLSLLKAKGWANGKDTTHCNSAAPFVPHDVGFSANDRELRCVLHPTGSKHPTFQVLGAKHVSNPI